MGERRANHCARSYHFVIALWRAKKRNFRRMNYQRERETSTSCPLSRSFSVSIRVPSAVTCSRSTEITQVGFLHGAFLYAAVRRKVQRSLCSFLLPLCFFQSTYLCAIGIFRPIPKARLVTFKPGAACSRLYSFRSTRRWIQRTVFSLKPRAMMSRALKFSST